MRWTLALLTVGLLAFSACRSHCARVCDKQAECAASARATPDDDMAIAKQAELCKTMCETMSSDPARKAKMAELIACAYKPCAEYAACVRAIE